MRISRQFLFSGVLVAMIGQLPFTGLQAYQCDCFESHHQTGGHCEHCCDGGLLDIVDGFLGRIHQQVNRTTRSLHAELGIGGWKKWGNCDSYCDDTCQEGCQGSVANELGVRTGVTNGCQSCQNGSVNAHQEVDDSSGSPPVPPPLSETRNGRGQIDRSQQAEKLQPRLPQSTSKQEMRAAPGETHPAPWEHAPPNRLPDAMVDPFVDENQTAPGFNGANRSGGRTIRGRTIQYRRNSGSESQDRHELRPTPAPSYRERFDPQANNAASSADYWAGTEETPVAKSSKVATVSDQVPILQQIHKRAYSLKLADTKAASGDESGLVDELQETQVQETQQTQMPARLPQNAAQPLGAPVQPLLRLKAQPTKFFQEESGPYSNPLRN